ncbi:hypothetical protein [Herbiconiux flava]|uniref:Uncharacterized protein n=1 Tax=Herbiconiux flava TaxID=881268 RepID=A0A852SNS1_9MICO|nr:hypothetical protein [Herbiconiux flava]NYD70447.1 hypothetical protein [Herbiconiux flava]GLK17202.1 hypothetical protein GCM10017602_16840 [Herbiconiux flava]
MISAARLHEIAAEIRGDQRSSLADLTDDELLEMLAAHEVLGRAARALQGRLSGEVGVPSRTELGNEA